MKKKHKNSSGAKHQMTEQSLRELDKETLVSLLLKMHEQYQSLSESIQIIMREKYGTKTERFVDPDQLNLFGSKSENQTPEKPTNSNESSRSSGSQSTPQKKKRNQANPRSSNLERVQIRGPRPTEAALRCSCCDKSRRLANETTRGSRYAYKPATVLIEQFLAMIFQCDECGSTVVVEPEAPAGAVKLGADPALISVIAVERFDDSIPLHRQERRFARLGAPIAKSSMCGWLAATAKLLMPVYNAMKLLLLASKVIATDDTPMKVLDRSKRKKIKLGRVWIHAGDNLHPVNLFDYTNGRGREGPITFLKGFNGFLLGDCFSGNQALCAETGCIHVACNAHARRYFIKAEPNNKAACAQMLRMYDELFKIERDANDLDIFGDERKKMRLQESKPLLDKMKAWLDQQSLIALPKSAFGKAVYYCLNNWTELTNFLQDGDLRLDNNLAEQEMKRVAINRKNSLFFGSDQGGEDAVIFMSLISTCRRNNVEPFAYLKDTIERLTANPDEDPSLLLPHTWKPPCKSAEMEGALGTPKNFFAVPA